ncbi:GlxA family transcriptional regulator [Sulfitobacter sp. S190]|uniref:GlxA family transcriptional regulator n=1 Tax=Sulfitobacter sp. S190 TaxID=2867022 RepID=UPI0021A81F52|nr:helix-turn-helix domain-containing protein [Sulfitobacter sp. S190]
MSRTPRDAKSRSFELFIQRGFAAQELTAVQHVLATANSVAGRTCFTNRITSDMPGLVTGQGGVLARAEPAIDDYGFSDVLIVVGGTRIHRRGWAKRTRAMQRSGRTVVLLSDAATAFIRTGETKTGHVTTHWRDTMRLSEQGYYPNLTTRFSENAGGFITAAGGGATAELIVGLIADVLAPDEIAELGNRLLLSVIRSSDSEQPRDIADNAGLFDARVTQAIKLMETNMEEPLAMTELTALVGLSTRHLERVFRDVFDDTPARFYKRLRVKRARTMIEDTLVPLIDIAIATGFCSHNALARAVRDEFGITPSKMRARKSIGILRHTDPTAAGDDPSK